MSRALVTLGTKESRQKVAKWAYDAPWGTRVEFKEAKRSSDQNSKMWACLTDIAQQVQWHGIKLTPDSWKLVFMDALHRELRLVPNIEGTGFVNLNTSSSDLSKSEMSDLIELIVAFGANHGVQFTDQPQSVQAA